MEPIGKLIKEVLRNQKRSITWFAEELGCDRSNVYRIFQKRSIDTDMLARISKILHRNFFEDLAKNVSQKEDSQDLQ